jgi:DNA-binding LacI/PurR family transcriptional regulator
MEIDCKIKMQSIEFFRDCDVCATFLLAFIPSLRPQQTEVAGLFFNIGGAMARIKNIKELATLAGVSTGTVSRALAGSELISSKTRERIQALAREHDFRPNVLARNLRIQRTGSIGVLIPLGHETGQHISDPFFITMLGLLADELTERGYDLVLSRVIPTDDDWLDRIVLSGKADGYIVIGQSNQSEVLDAVASRYRPLVVWGGHSKGQIHCSVGSDNVSGGELAANHLLKVGCRRLAFFGDTTGIEIAQRLEGCRKALARYGLANSLSVFPVHLASEAGEAEVTAYLSGPSERPDGIICASDVIAMSTLRTLAELGVAIPNEIRVIGYDGLAIGEQTVPRLSTIRQDLTTGAHNLVDLLLRRISGEDTSSVVMTPELVVRMSS